MKLLQILAFACIVRPILMIVVGLNVHGRERLPLEGPAIIAANHNSHLDAVTLLSLWPLLKLWKVRPLAAADYFLSNPALAWLTLNLMRIIPIDRQRKDKDSDPLAEPIKALERGEIILLFPEGSRGEPEQLSPFKTGVSRLVERHPEIPIVPIFMYGLGKVLPRGDFLLVPFFCDILVGNWLYWRGSIEATMQAYEAAMSDLAARCEAPEWE